MSCTPFPPTQNPLPLPSPTGPRKRTSSFSTPNPNKAKAHRTHPMSPPSASFSSSPSSLRRTSSYITLPGILPTSTPPDNSPLSSTSSSTSECSSLALRHYKEQRQRQRRRSQISHSSPATTSGPHFTIGPAPHSSSTSSLPIPQQPTPSRKPIPAQISTTNITTPSTPPRATSPLSPTKKLLPPRASFPRSKPTPNLYKIAITARMRCSPEGQKILSMGPRLAVSILTATRELEKIVAAQHMQATGCSAGNGGCDGGLEGDGDVTMVDGTMSGMTVGGVMLNKSWIVVPGGEDLEMVDCSS